MEKYRIRPNLRFAQFTDEWIKKKYNEIYSFYSTNSLSRENLNYEINHINNIHYGDIHTKFSTLFDTNNEIVPFINKDIDLSKIKDENYCQVGDLVIADASEDYNDIGKTIEIINLNNQKTVAGLHTFLARPNKHPMALGFAGYMLKSAKVRKQVKTIAQGSKVLGLATGRLGNIELIIPNILEQEKIATFLTAVDEKINLLQKKKQGLEQYKKGVMQQLFSQKLRFKKEDGSDYPEWEEKKLEKISKITIGEFVIKTKQNPKAMYPVYNGGKSYTGFYDDYNSDGDKIIISARGANAGFVNYEQGKFWAGNSCYSIDIIDKHTNNVQYMFYFIKFRQHMFTDYQQAANIPSVSKKDVQIFKIFCPVIQEQTEIANFLNTIDNKIDIINSQLENTQYFKKGLLQQMFV